MANEGHGNDKTKDKDEGDKDRGNDKGDKVGKGDKGGKDDKGGKGHKDGKMSTTAVKRSRQSYDDRKEKRRKDGAILESLARSNAKMSDAMTALALAAQQFAHSPSLEAYASRSTPRGTCLESFPNAEKLQYLKAFQACASRRTP